MAQILGQNDDAAESARDREDGRCLGRRGSVNLSVNLSLDVDVASQPKETKSERLT